MNFSDDFLEQLRSRVSLAEIIGRRVPLTRRGREFVACCPFHKEKTPSFTVNEQKGFYHCFGCGAHGSVFDFVMQNEGVGFPEAVERLAVFCGIAMPQKPAADPERARRRQSLFDVLDLAASLFQRWLRMPEGKAALEYLRGRGIDDGAIARFRLGCSGAGRSSIKAALAREGVDEALMIEAGLVIRPEDPAEPSFDRFRGRVMFPISDRRGRIVGFGGRVLGSGEPKYLNSPETPLFHKGRLLYGLPAAAEAARRTGRLVVVEGYMDVIGLALAGYEETVAPLGTALTEDQMQELWRLVPEPILCFDPDAAGRRAAARVCERVLPLLRPGIGLRFAFPTAETGDDPDQLIRRYPRQFIVQTLAEAVPLSQMLVWLETSGRSPASPEERAAIAGRLRQRALSIQDRTVREQFLQAFRERLWRARRDQRTSGQRSHRSHRGASEPAPVVAQSQGERVLRSARVDAERTLLAILYHHPEIFDQIEDEIGGLGFVDPEHDRLRQAIILAFSEGVASSETLARRLEETGDGSTLQALLADPLVRGHRLIAAAASAVDVKATWDENFRLLRRIEAEETVSPAGPVTDEKDIARRLALKRIALEEESERSQ